jgi:hypothetical protein
MDNFCEKCAVIMQENSDLKNEIIELKEKLKKYTAPDRKKKYYEKHKEEILNKVKEYNLKNKPSAEKIKEYNKKAYEKRKEKKENVTTNI